MVSYLLGSVSTGILYSRALGQDIRTQGSKNSGATNMTRVHGLGKGALTFLGDCLKGVAAVLFGRWLAGDAGALVAGTCVVLGHMWPVFFGFQGGKGVAVMFAAIWFVEWRAAVVVLILFLVLMAATRYMSLSVMIAAASAPVTIAVVGAEHPAILPIIAACVLFMIWRHRENIGRLLHGTESKFTLHSVKGASKNKPGEETE